MKLMPIEEPFRDEDRAYLAAVIDLNGSVYMAKGGKGDWNVKIEIKGLKPPVRAWLLSLFPSRGFNQQPAVQSPTGLVRFSTYRALRILASCFYFLKDKREKARVALEFGQIRVGRRGPKNKASSDILIKQAELAARLSNLNNLPSTGTKGGE